MDELKTKVTFQVVVQADELNEFVSGLGRANNATEGTVKQLRQLETAATKALGGAANETNRLTAAQKAQEREARATASAQRALESELIRQRYALYDVATTYGALGAALLGADVYAIKLAADFESAFTNVQRTSEASTSQLAGLRDVLIDMSTQIPLSFAELSEIATLGNQLGIQASGIEEFTRTVAQFSAVTGVSIQETAQSFGALGNILGLSADQYAALGSAIALTGRRGVTTETQILSLTKEIAQQATSAGFTAEQVVGLSAALGNLRLPPERSRGALTTYFQTLNAAVAEGGQKLQDFATVIGVTTGQLEAMVRSGQGEEVFSRFIASLQDFDNVDTTAALERLGLAQLRVSDVFQRLSSDTEGYNKAQKDAAQGFREATELADQYALITDDLNTKFKTLVNAVNALIEAATGGNVAGLAGLLQVFIDITNAAREFVEIPFGQEISKIALVVTGLVGAFFAYRAAAALATASTYALAVAQSGLAGLGVRGAFTGLIGQIFGVKTATDAATGATLGLRGALVALGRATVILAAIAGTVELFTNFGAIGDSVNGVVESTTHWSDTLDRVGTRLVDVGGLTVGIENGMYRVGDAAFTLGDIITGLISPLAFIVNMLNGGFAKAGKSKGFGPKTSGTGQVAQDAANAAAAFNNLGSAIGGAGGAAAGAAQEIRTLVDYANDLSQVFSRSFDIRFGSTLAFDAVTSAWSDINEEIDEYRRKVQELTADRSVQAYFLSVAEAYDDELRAGVIRSNIADIDAEIADATAKASTELNGNSKAAITNRKRITDLLRGYEGYIEALAASGADQATLNAAVNRSQNEFMAQAQALGYSNAQLQPYIQSFNDLRYAINNVPRNITVGANVNPAVTAIKELLARVSSGAYGSGSLPIRVNTGEAENAGYRAGVAAMRGFAYGSRDSSKNYGTGPLVKSLYNFGFSDGGYTGMGTKYQPAGVVHKGEFVIPADATRALGVGNLYSLMRTAQQGRSYAAGGAVGVPRVMASSGTSGAIMELGPKSLAHLDRAINRRVDLYLGDSAVAQSASAGSRVEQSRGRN